MNENPSVTVYQATSIEGVFNAYKNTVDPAGLIAFPDLGPVTELVIADSHKGVNLKTQVSVACEGPEGYLGVVVVQPRLEASQYCCVHLLRSNWVVTRYQAFWFEWRHGRQEFQYSRPRHAGAGRYWKRIRVRWEPGLPAHDDYDYLIEENLWTDAVPLAKS